MNMTLTFLPIALSLDFVLQTPAIVLHFYSGSSINYSVLVLSPIRETGLDMRYLNEPTAVRVCVSNPSPPEAEMGGSELDERMVYKVKRFPKSKTKQSRTKQNKNTKILNEQMQKSDIARRKMI